MSAGRQSRKKPPPARRSMTKVEAQAWKRRWEAVNAAEIEELRRTPFEVKLRQLASLMASVDGMGWREALVSQNAEVLQRWNKLRRHYGV